MINVMWCKSKISVPLLLQSILLQDCWIYGCVPKHYQNTGYIEIVDSGLDMHSVHDDLHCNRLSTLLNSNNQRNSCWNWFDRDFLTRCRTHKTGWGVCSNQGCVPPYQYHHGAPYQGVFVPGECGTAWVDHLPHFRCWRICNRVGGQ